LTESELFQQQNYLIVKNVLRPELCQLVSDYALFKASVSQNVRTKDPLAYVHREYGDPLMEMLLEKLTPTIETALGKSLWPTLSFYYVYRQGHQLTPHKDRSSCQFVASLCIDADSEFKKTHQSWPLFLKAAGQTLPITLNFGDLLIFKGSEQEHWREIFAGSWFVSAIFSYVEKDGPFAFQKFDQRKSLGRPHVGMFRWSLGSLWHQLRSSSRR